MIIHRGLVKLANLIIVGLLLVFYACGQRTSKNNYVKDGGDDLHSLPIESELTIEEKQKSLGIEDRIDSIRLEKALNDALNIITTSFRSDDFHKEYELIPDDSSYIITIEIVIGYLFTNQQKHCLLRRHIPWATYIDLFQIVGNEPKVILRREQGGMTYIRDTIFDANGDGFKDFLVHWYPSSGCCLRNVYNVYLNQADKGTFTDDYQFINPTFSPQENVIRGVEYGHPGEVGLYKYKWNGFQVDTLEFIYPDVNTKGCFIKTKKSSYRPSVKDGVILKSVPAEYHTIESYEWFTDF